MQLFKNYLDKKGVDYFIIEMSENLLFGKFLINEGQWVKSGKKNWMVKIEAEIPEYNQQRHVHIARSKHIKSKNMQVSWNQDGTKHDRKSFNSKIGSIKIVQEIAREVLKLPKNIKLKEVKEPINILTQLNETINIDIDFQQVVFKLILAP